MLTKRRFVALAAAFLMLPSGLMAKDYNHSDLIESFAVLPAVQQVRVSDDGKRMIIMRSTSKNGDYIIEVRDVNNLSADPVLLGADKMEIQGASWLNNDKILVNFSQNIQDGARNYWVSKAAIVNADGTGNWKVPFPKDNFARFNVLDSLPQDPDHILITYDINNNRYPDVIRYNINNGLTKTILRGNQKLSGGFIPDPDGEIRAATGIDRATTSIIQYARLPGESDWKEVKVVSATEREEFQFLYFSSENPEEVYVRASNGKDTAGIYTLNIRTGEYSERLFGLESVDSGGVILSQKMEDRGRLLGFRYTGKQPTMYYLDEYEQSIHDGVKALFPKKHVSIQSRSEDDNAMILFTQADNDPGTYYLLKDKKELKTIGERFPLIDREKLGDVKYVKYKARDGLTIPAYVTIPKVGKKPFPTVVMPHGGPWVRDEIIYDEWAQLLASHGYLVIQPQYRGSTGYGLNHWKAGDKLWGLAMQDDKDDGALWLVKKGLADPDRLAMFGWSYGGYAAFAASMREDNIYQCAIAGAGVSDLDMIGANINGSRFGRLLQGPTVKGISPLDHVDKVNIPILVIHGDIDQRVPVEHSRLFVEEAQKHGIDHQYIELEGADHFYNTLYYDHKSTFYPALVNYLDNTCFSKTNLASN